MKIINDEINIMETITKRNRPMRIFFLCLGSFIIALFYNSFIVPNNIVYGGVGGLAIIIKQLCGINTTITINVITFILIAASYKILGAKKTTYSVIGFIVYDIMINLTTPIAPLINIQFDSFLFAILVYAILMGVGYGIIYKTGFNTGGSDILLTIIQHYKTIPNSAISNVMNGVVIVIGASIFGIINSIYAIIFLKVCNYVSDHVLIGISNSKHCLITTRYKEKVEKYLSEDLEVGYTMLDSTNGIGILPKSIIMCVIPSDRFYDLKNELKHIDEKAKLISSDCYAVEGGHINQLIRF